jgi:hypothetical protein
MVTQHPSIEPNYPATYRVLNLGAEIDQATVDTYNENPETGTSGDAYDIPGHSTVTALAATTEATLLTRTLTITDDDVVWAAAYILACGEYTSGEWSYLDARLYIDATKVDELNIRSNSAATDNGWTNVSLNGSAEKSAGEIETTLRIYNKDSLERDYAYISWGLVMGSVKGKFA